MQHHDYLPFTHLARRGWLTLYGDHFAIQVSDLSTSVRDALRAHPRAFRIECPEACYWRLPECMLSLAEQLTPQDLRSIPGAVHCDEEEDCNYVHPDADVDHVRTECILRGTFPTTPDMTPVIDKLLLQSHPPDHWYALTTTINNCYIYLAKGWTVYIDSDEKHHMVESPPMTGAVFLRARDECANAQWIAHETDQSWTVCYYVDAEDADCAKWRFQRCPALDDWWLEHAVLVLPSDLPPNDAVFVGQTTTTVAFVCRCSETDAKKIVKS